MCLNPKWIYKKGTYKENNYNGMAGDFYEIGTYSKCGCCSICVSEKSNNWVIRNHYESLINQDKCFITLTYAENPIIIVQKDGQDFMKRFRWNIEKEYGKKIRMFGCYEYGEINNRPHLHFIIYGWKEPKPKFLCYNKKKQLVMQSDIVQRSWGLGRTSYQDFGNHEIPYISLYNTPQESFKRAYKMTRAKLNKLELMHRNNARMDNKQRKNLLAELQLIRGEMDEKKAKYTVIRERNTWSQGLGWAKFEEMYNKSQFYNFIEYIEDKEFVTPTPWVKRLANMGDVQAIEEMRKRQEQVKQSATEQEEILKNLKKVDDRRRKEILDLSDKRRVIEVL